MIIRKDWFTHSESFIAFVLIITFLLFALPLVCK
jgi:hypothetical protein